jgi:hypothetical protein
VNNTAYIGFDYNEYVQTNQTVTKVVDSVTSICPGATVSFVMPDAGEGFSYQWQVDSTGIAFSDLANNGVYSGVNGNTLTIISPPTSAYGFKYRCVASKGAETVYGWMNILKFNVKWQGTVSTAWENVANWSCLRLPDAFTDVIIDKVSRNPVVNVNTSCRSVKVSPTATLTIKTGVGLTLIANGMQ